MDFICMVILLSLAHSINGQSVFKVTDYGAKGDGVTDDTKAFKDAWAATCDATGGSSPSMLVPSGQSFLVGPVQFEGPCKSSTLSVQIMGNIVAPSPSAWDGASTEFWLAFHAVDGLTVTGNGVLDGKGENWWPKRCSQNGGAGCIEAAPTMLRLASCNDLKLSYFSAKNSQQMHIAISMSQRVNVTQLKVTAPETSPNTDGIHLDRCQNVQITGATIGTGDDCISIGDGNSFITIDTVTCGPGHGVSVGSLGKDGASAAVEHVVVKNIQFIGTTNGARIKTWQGGKGYAKSISFTNINFTNVDNPVIIDQFYCNGASNCPNQPGAVQISNITYSTLTGTSSQQSAVTFNCSENGSCTGIHVTSMYLTAATGQETYAVCHNAQGDTSGNVSPKIPCLS